MSDLAAQRRFFAEEVQMIANLRSVALVEALATVARERFLPQGPWTIRSETDVVAGPRMTSDADPRHVYHNIGIAIDPARLLFNGVPGLLSMAIDALGLQPGARVMHLGTGTGYYTALMAHCVGSGGRVLGLEVDATLASRAAANLASMPWVEVRHGDGSASLEESFDAMLINAGVTHPLDAWLDGLAPAGRIVLPLTATMGSMGNIGKGLMLLLTRTADANVFDVRVLSFVAIAFDPS
jgi:protein-L-isoaspartate(D-aspartate) O-methyltransferase